MLDMWHTFLESLLADTSWKTLLTGNEMPGLPPLPDGWTVEKALFVVVAIPVALIALHVVRVIFLTLHGKKCRALRALNKTCDFDNGIKPRYEYKVSLNSRKQLERYDFDRFFLDEYGRSPQGLSAVFNRALSNEKKRRKYMAEVEQLLGVKAGDAVRVKFWDSLEVKLCKRRLKKPAVSPVFHCVAEYASPKGQTRLSRDASYTVKQMEAIAKQYQKNQEFQTSKAHQRSLMTDSLRYDIMKRDNFRCVLCGRTANEGVKLHVDHIVPVAKGGLTVPENLRTLCDQCNLGKSDKYDPHGAN